MYCVKKLKCRKISVNEYNRLRTEAVKRIELITTQAATAISASIATWVMAVPILAASFSDAM